MPWTLCIQLKRSPRSPSRNKGGLLLREGEGKGGEGREKGDGKGREGERKRRGREGGEERGGEGRGRTFLTPLLFSDNSHTDYGITIPFQTGVEVPMRTP